MEGKTIKKLFILVLIVLLLFPSYQIYDVQATEEVTIIEIKDPIVEVLDLIVDGSGVGGTWVNISYDFDYVIRIIWHLHFVATSIDFDKFGDETALTNGVNVYYNDISVLDHDNITENHYFGHASYDVNYFFDEKNPEGRFINSRFTFAKFNIDGLLINDERTLSFHVQDNITDLSAPVTGSIHKFQAAVEGYKITQEFIYNPIPERKDFLGVVEETFRDNSALILLLVIGVLSLIIVVRFFKRRM